MNGPVIHITLGKANPERANGINVIVHELASAFSRSGICIEVWGLTPTPTVETPERPYLLKLFRRKALGVPLDSKLRAALEELPTTSLVHFHGGLLPEFVFMARILRGRRIPWVLMPHGCYSKTALSRGRLKKRLFIWFVDRFLIRHAARIHAGGVGSTGGIMGIASPKQVVVIPNGSSMPEPPFAKPAVAPFTLVFCGRLARYHKGLDLLWGGLAIARANCSSLHLNLVGGGYDTVELRELARSLAIDDLIRGHGTLFGERKRVVLAGSSCFILTSRHEGFPMALVEAAALGLPLLVTEGTNFADYVRKWDCGMVTAETTEEAIAETIVAMANSSPERLKEMGRNSVRMVQAELQWSRIVERIRNEIYRPIWAERS
jgi:glycosyltransferase involved in cell wall biosynthesis